MAKTIVELREMMARRGIRAFDLPQTGQISAFDINEELGRVPGNAFQFNINGAEERALAEIPTGEIRFSDFHGKPSGPNWVPVYSGNLTIGFWAASENALHGYYPSESIGALVPTAITWKNGPDTILALWGESSVASGFIMAGASQTTQRRIRITYPGGQFEATGGSLYGIYFPPDEADGDAFYAWLVANNGTTQPLQIDEMQSL